MHIISDLSNLIWTGLRAGKDKEGGRKIMHEGKEVFVNGAEYGFHNAVSYILGVLQDLDVPPKSLVFVADGDSGTAFRRVIYPNYKTNRGGNPPEMYEQFEKCKALLKADFLKLGASFVSQANVEADDIIAYLAENLDACIILSTDNDLQQCISPTARRYLKGEYDENYLGPFPTRYTRLYKALVGDSSDTIKGAAGFGEKAFLDLYCLFGNDGLDAMESLIQNRKLTELSEDVPQLKALQRIIDDRDNVYLCYDVVKLYPERINTYRRPLQWEVGMVKGAVTDARLRPFQGREKLVSAANYENTLAWFKDAVQDSVQVSFDIETTTPEESTEWLAQRKKKSDEDEDVGIDVLGQTLVGGSITLGRNNEFTLYFAVNHSQSDGLKNITSDQAKAFIEAIPKGMPIIVQNASFELSVLRQCWDLGENGWEGFLPNALDTKIMASMVDENNSSGLKQRSKAVLGYDQKSYAEVTAGRKMHELSATETFAYGCDDTICTAALFDHYRMIMEIEKTWQAYLDVDQLPVYLDAERFIQGTPISMETLLAQEKDDQQAYDGAWAVVREYLVNSGWPGAHPPEFTLPLTPTQIKEAYLIVNGAELKTAMRKTDKLIAHMRADGSDELLVNLIEAVEAGTTAISTLQDYVTAFFKGEPTLNMGSPKQVATLLYDPRYLGLEVRVNNRPTDKMKAEGLRVGSPSTDSLAVEYGLKFEGENNPVVTKILKALQVVSVTSTRIKMYYRPYRFVQHWRTGLVHACFNQSATNTRRYSSSSPNLQQLPKHPKATGEEARFRAVIVPHQKDAVIVSLDFNAQEMRIIADASQDENLVSCYVGESKKDMHSIVAVGILKSRLDRNKARELLRDAGMTVPVEQASGVLFDMRPLLEYRNFETALKDPAHKFNKLNAALRNLGKKVNFTVEYGAQAPKLAKTMIVDLDEAQGFIDARQAAFPRVAEWKLEMVEEARRTGVIRSACGALRHLGPALLSPDGYTASKADRQAVNFYVQGSSAEMTKLAMARVWKSRVLHRFDARFIGPIHDELVFSCAIADLIPFLQSVHASMVAPFAGMQVPVVSSISFGKNFKDQVEIGNTPDAEKITEALWEIFPARAEEWRKAA